MNIYIYYQTRLNAASAFKTDRSITHFILSSPCFPVAQQNFTVQNRGLKQQSFETDMPECRYLCHLVGGHPYNILISIKYIKL